MFANTLIFLFVITMTCWWGLAHGVFSAFLQLMATILAASFAVAMWELIVLDLLIWHIPRYAWGVGLLGPFVLWLVLLRTVLRVLVPTGVKLGRATNVLGGAACGLLSGVLASGVTVLGLGFLPLPPDAGGYQPMVIQEKWTITENPHGMLWLPVDRYAQSFLAGLSAGTFSGNWPLAKYQPDLIRQAALFRMRYDPNHSIVVTPNNVAVTQLYGGPMPVEGLDVSFAGQLDHGQQTLSVGNQLLVVDTHWQINENTLDTDQMLRVPPTQVRLISQRRDLSQQGVRLHAPVGWVQVDPGTGERVYSPFDSSAKPVLQGSLAQEHLLGWVFVLPIEEEARFVVLRRLRRKLPALDTDPLALIAALGRPQKATPVPTP